jgi:hypothetical protein
MTFSGNVPAIQVTESLNQIHYSPKTALRVSQQDIADLISDMADPNKTSIIIDGREIDKKDTITLSLALNDKMERLQNQTTSIISVFSELYKLEKSLGGMS